LAQKCLIDLDGTAHMGQGNADPNIDANKALAWGAMA